MTSTASPPVRLRPKACEVCEKQVDLIQCQGCHVTHYCGPEHQAAHLGRHKEACAAVRGSAYRPVATILYSASGDSGEISQITLRIRSHVELVEVKLSQLLQEFAGAGPRTNAVDHAFELAKTCFRDSRSGWLGNVLPVLAVRLGRDQWAWASLKEFTKSHASGLSPCPAALPTNDNDKPKPSDDILNLTAKTSDERSRKCHLCPMVLNTASIAILIKIRAMLEINEMLKSQWALRRRNLPWEIEAMVRSQLAPIMTQHHPEMIYIPVADLQRRHDALKDEVRWMFETFKDKDAYFWAMRRVMRAQTFNTNGPGGPEMAAWQAELEVCAAWRETPGALELFEKIQAMEWSKKKQAEMDSLLGRKEVA